MQHHRMRGQHQDSIPVSAMKLSSAQPLVSTPCLPRIPPPDLLPPHGTTDMHGKDSSQETPIIRAGSGPRRRFPRSHWISQRRRYRRQAQPHWSLVLKEVTPGMADQDRTNQDRMRGFDSPNKTETWGKARSARNRPDTTRQRTATPSLPGA